MSAIILFYTKKAGLTRAGIKKLSDAGVTAVQVSDHNELHWPDPNSVDWISSTDELSVMMLRALSKAGGGAFLGEFLLQSMRRKHSINPDGSLREQPKDKP